MDGIKKGGYFLDFVDDNCLGCGQCPYKLEQCFRSGSKAPERIRLKKINYERVRKNEGNPG